MQNIAKRLSIWAAVVALILLIPLVLTVLGGGVDGDGWHWTLFDFIFMGALLFGAGVIYELVSRNMNSSGVYRAAVGVAVVTAVLLVWINAAVGIIGEGDLDSPNGMYFGVLAVGVIGAIIARFQPRGMARTLFAMGLAQFLVPVIAFMIWPPGVISWAPGVLGVFALNSFFVALWITSALLFLHAGREHN